MARRGARLLVTLLAAAVVALAVAWQLGVRRWLAFETGSQNTTGAPHNYNFFSGFGSIILPPVLNGLALASVFWWHNQCHVAGCLFYARRKTAAGDRACWRHHPERRVTVAELRRRHHLYLGERPGDG